MVTLRVVADGRAARWAGQREKRRAEVVAAALAAIEEHGPWVSTEQVAERAGISRPQLYRHFSDADDLHDAVAHRVAEMFAAAMLPFLTAPSGSPREIITRVVDAFVSWLVAHSPLYDYLVVRAVGVVPGRRGPAADVRLGIAGALRELFVAHAPAGVDLRYADPLAFAVAGMVESATARWLAAPHGLDRAELVARLSSWVWVLIEDFVRHGGAELDPDVPLPDPSA